MFGQIPTNGSWRGGDGIFGQVPTNGGYAVQGVGTFPMGTVYVQPPAYNDSGLLRIDESSRPAFEWSINSTTTDEPSAGASIQEAAGFADTYLMSIASTPGQQGNNWLSTYMAAGYVVLFRGKSVEELNQMLDFIITSDPAAVKHYAAYEADNYMVVGGPEPIIALAKQGAPGIPVPGLPPAGVCPEGQVGVPPLCMPVPGGVPTTPPTTPGAGECGPNQISVAGQCFNTPPCGAGEQEVFGVCYPLPGTAPPPGTQPPVTPPPGLPVPPPGTQPPPGVPPAVPPTQPSDKPVHVAGTGAPAWLFPALVGVAGLSVFVIIRASRKRGKRAA
jgi:hypothetical protein